MEYSRKKSIEIAKIIRAIDRRGAGILLELSDELPILIPKCLPDFARLRDGLTARGVKCENGKTSSITLAISFGFLMLAILLLAMSSKPAVVLTAGIVVIAWGGLGTFMTALKIRRLGAKPRLLLLIITEVVSLIVLAMFVAFRWRRLS